MPRIDLDLSSLEAARKLLQQSIADQRALDLQLTNDKAELDAAVAAGESPNFTVPIQVRIEERSAERSALVGKQRELQARIDALANGLLLQQDPERMAASMDGHQPIALLPMRIETRYFPQPKNLVDRLRIRVYPDDVNTIEHVPALTPAEQQGGAEYWTARFTHHDDEAARVLRDLTLAFGRGRAAWIVRVMTPDNAIPAADADPQLENHPQFPKNEVIDARAKTTRAVLLPDRWCAIGYASGRREVFRKWGERIPDELLLSPDWLSTDDPEAMLGGERAWLVDFDAALVKGMAIEITQREVNEFALRHHSPLKFNLANDTLERLVIVGLEWTKSAEDSAADLADLFAAHRDSSGLGFVPLGTPTNNTEAAPAGYSPSHERIPPAPPASGAALPNEQDALQLLRWALGIAPETLPADNIANAHLAEQRTALHMMNALWRGTFGHYLSELWGLPRGDDGNPRKPTMYGLRRYAVAHVRPTGALPIVRIHKQPYGILPVVGRRFVDPGGSVVETSIAKVVGVLRPMWEIASAAVPLMKDGNVLKAKDILQMAPWSQQAFYRDKEADKNFCSTSRLVPDPPPSPREILVKQILTAVGVSDFASVHIFGCSDFRIDPPYTHAELAGVPWVLADDKNPIKEAPDDATLAAPHNNYLEAIAKLSIERLALAASDLYRSQSGPSLLEALISYSVQKEQGDAAETYGMYSGAIDKVLSTATTRMPYVEAALENEAMFTVQTHKELMNVSIASVTGTTTLGDHIANAFVGRSLAIGQGHAVFAATDLVGLVADLDPPVRDLGTVNASLDYLSRRTVGELNIAFRSTLDTFSYRLDAWIAARAHRRLEQMRDRKPGGIYIGGFAWVENLKADSRPDSEGHLLAPSPGQAASAAIMRSGFMANHEQGVFDIALDSHRTRRALDILQGLTRDQPLAALYGYRIERGLRDALLGKFIWPLRMAFPWRPAGAELNDEPKEAVGARDVVDGSALMEAWENGTPAVRTRLEAALKFIGQLPPSADDTKKLAAVMQNALDLKDSVSDLLMAEGTHQIVQGNLERAGAAMAIVDKQSLPIETQVNRTPRGGASYTQRLAVLCPEPARGWPEDRRSSAEPGVNAWLAKMLGDPARYRFVAHVHRRDPEARADDARDRIDVEPVVVAWNALGLSPLSAVMMAGSVSTPRLSGGKESGETGFRSALVAALTHNLADPAAVIGLDIQQEGDAPDTLGLGDFEALAMTLKGVLDKSRPVTRKDLVRPDDPIERTLQDDAIAHGVSPDEGEYPGVDLIEIETRADELVLKFDVAGQALLASVGADALLAALADFTDILPPSAWPAEVLAIDARNADPAGRDARATAAVPALQTWFDARLEAVNAGPPLLDKKVPATHAQRVQHAIDRIKLVLGKDFPVLPRCSLGPYASGFNASLAEQDALTVGDRWCVNGWLTRMARVRDGSDRFAAAMSAHEALCEPAHEGDFKLVQFPYRAKQIWAALPEAWREDAGTPFDPTQAPEELHDFLAARPGAPYKDIHRAAPDLAIAFHTPGGLDGLDKDQRIAGMVCDEWPEFVPDPFQTAGIGFHYDAPGARPPQSILLALPPRLDQDAWDFDDVVDVIHEAFDLARLRGVSPKEFGGGLGALLPASYLPQTYTTDLPSVQLLEMQREARKRFASSSLSKGAALTLGKV